MASEKPRFSYVSPLQDGDNQHVDGSTYTSDTDSPTSPTAETVPSRPTKQCTHCCGTFGDVLEVCIYGDSRLNPTGLCNNCVSVVLTKLLGYQNDQELWRAVGHQQTSDNGLTIEEINELLCKTRREFVFKEIYNSDNHGIVPESFIVRLVQHSAYSIATGSLQTSVVHPTVRHTRSHERQMSAGLNLENFFFPRGGIFETSLGETLTQGVTLTTTLEVGLLYVRPDETGHCINGSFEATSSDQTQTTVGPLKARVTKSHQENLSWSFLCYQYNDHGSNVTAEIQSATRIYFFAFLDDDQDKSALFEKLCEKVLVEKEVGNSMIRKIHRWLGMVR